MTNDLITWVNQEILKRGWSRREVALKCGMSHGNINLILNENHPVSLKFCLQMAKAFNRPDIEMITLGLLPNTAENEPYKQAILTLTNIPNTTKLSPLELISIFASKK